MRPFRITLSGQSVLQRRAQLRRVEPVEIEVAQIDRQHHRHVAVAVLEQVPGRALRPVIVEALALPALVRRRHGDMGAPEGVDEGLSVMVAPVLGSRIPDMGMRIDDEDSGAFRRDVHFGFSRRFWPLDHAPAHERRAIDRMVSDRASAVQHGLLRQSLPTALRDWHQCPVIALPPCTTRPIVGTSPCSVHRGETMSLSGIFARLVAVDRRRGDLFPASAATARSQPAFGSAPAIPPARRQGIPTLKMPTARGWAAGQTPIAAAGLQVNAFATGLKHPRWIHVLPNGDVLIAEALSVAGRHRHRSSTTPCSAR